MTTRTTERAEFLGDILTTAIEGGVGYWSRVSQYQYVSDGEVHVYVGERTGDEPHAVLHEMDDDEMDDDEGGYKAEGLELTIDKIATALGRFRRGGIEYASDGYCKRITEASRENDAGEIDAGDADNIVQVALLGEIRYG